MTEFSAQLMAIAQSLYTGVYPNGPAWSTLTANQQAPWIGQAQKQWGVTSASNIAG